MTNAIILQYQELIKKQDLQPDHNQEKIINHLQNLYDHITGDQSFSTSKKKKYFWNNNILNKKNTASFPQGLYIWGGVGRGKSMLMDLFFKTLPDHIAKRRIHFHEFMIETHQALHKARQSHSSNSAILSFAKHIANNTKVLCFDEFHITDITDAMILGRLFTALFQQGIIIITTSNWPPDRLYEDGLQRELFLPFITLLKEKLTIIELDSATDYRLQYLREAGVYFTPLGMASAQKADHLFDHLTDHTTPQQDLLAVKGRNIPVPYAAKGVARFQFSDLCEKALGAEDYLTIARQYHTVFLENIPCLKYDRRNETKRLILLIDAFYDQKTKLIITAEAPPKDLYQGHDYEFEFQRTISRLIEMQSIDYLGANFRKDN